MPRSTRTGSSVEAARRRTGLVDRTAFVDLTTVDDPDGVPLAVARALGLSGAELPAIRLAIGSGDTLLVMDNCEHVVDAAADVVGNLVHVVGPGVRVLATSRESLELDGESVIVIHPFADDDVMVALFVERAAAVGASAPGGDDELLAVVRSMPTRSSRAALLASAMLLAVNREPERLPALANELIDLLQPGASGALAAWDHLAGYHLRRDELDVALDYAGTALSVAKSLGEQSALVPLIALHALVLRGLGCAEDAARLRGAAPRKWSIFFQPERDELDAWLAQRFTAEQLKDFAAKGRAMDPDTLFAIAPAALAATRPAGALSSPVPGS